MSYLRLSILNLN